MQMLRGFSGDAEAIEPVCSEPHHHSYQTKALINRPDQSTPNRSGVCPSKIEPSTSEMVQMVKMVR